MSSAARSGRIGVHLATPAALRGLSLKTGGGGLIVGRDRHHAPVVVRVFRPQPTRIVLVGAVATAQLLTMRARALGVSLLVQTLRPGTWAAFGQRCGLGPDSLTIGSPGPPPSAPNGPGRRQLLVVDAGSVDVSSVPDAAGWRTVLLVREELTSFDIDTLVSADLVIIQRLDEVEAAVAAAALRLNQAQEWLSRIGPEMVAVSERARLRWALLSPTSVERQVFSTLARIP